ncbi:infection structure specific [Fusarium albosuccineum]|uniref:Infection structure specific n=1 Tax=Fusarium albosuccineum TaxID=1237068 RepID=A0A8H4PFP9_9HYPO|nr:infection structure specific [Fusarium albosuccineum]
MQIKTLSLVAATAATAAASVEDVKEVNVVHKILETVNVGLPGISLNPNKRSVEALFRRASNEECASSIISYYADAPLPTDDEVYDWIDAMDTGSCTFTATATLSDEILEYFSEVQQYLFDKGADRQEIIDECNVETIDNCGLGGGKIVFTASNSTKTVDLATALPTPTATSTQGSGNGNAAAPRGVAMGAVVAAAVGAIGVVMAL